MTETPLHRCAPLAARTLDEVAEIMAARGYPMTRQAVRYFEQNALRKLRENPEARRIFEETYGQD